MDEPDVKARMLDSLEVLWAERGFEAEGLWVPTDKECRDPAIQENFVSNEEIFTALTDRFFEEYRAAYEIAFKGNRNPTEQLLRLFHEATRVFERRRNFFRFIVTDFSKLPPELVQIWVSRFRAFYGSVIPLVHEAIPLLKHDPQVGMILGPAIASLAASHFLLKPILDHLGLCTYDEEFYRKYPQVIADLAATGMLAVVFGAKQGKYDQRKEVKGNGEDSRS